MKLVFYLALCLSFGNVFGQSNSSTLFSDNEDPNLFIDLGFGARLGNEKNGASDGGVHVNGGLGYMFSPIIGIKGDLGYDEFGSTSTTFRTSLQGVLSISKLADFDGNVFDLDFHTGFGWSTMWNKNHRAANPDYDDDKIIGKNDDMGNIIFGLTPIFNFPYSNSNQTLSLTADLSYVVLIANEQNIDWSAKLDKTTSGYLNFSLGIKIRIGTGK